jgi:hypothetical protein
MKNLFGGGMYEDKKDVEARKVFSSLPQFDENNA